MSTITSADPADLFTQLFDRLLPCYASAYRYLEEWNADEDLRERSDDIEELAVSGKLDPGSIDEWLDLASDDEEHHQRMMFGILRGLDQALRLVHPGDSTTHAGALDAIASRFEQTGSFATPDHGLLVPKWTTPDDNRDPVEWNDAFSHMLRLQSPVALHLRPALHDLSFAQGRLIDVGVISMIEDADDLDWTDDGTRYEVRPNATILGARIRDSITALDAAEVEIGVIGESSLDADLLAAWQAILPTMPQGDSPLTWILVGTGDVPSDDHGSGNTAIILDRTSGAVVARQSKRRRFEITKDQIEQYGLEGKLTAATRLEEGIDVGTVSCVLETSAGRLAILVCEDLAHVGTVGSDVLRSGASLLLCPELSSELTEKAWEHRHAGALQSSRHPIKVVVANSLAIPRSQGLYHQVKIAAGVVRSRFFAGTVGSAGEVTAFRITRNELLERILR